MCERSKWYIQNPLIALDVSLGISIQSSFQEVPISQTPSNAVRLRGKARTTNYRQQMLSLIRTETTTAKAPHKYTERRK